MAAYERFKWRPGGALQLTHWEGCHSCMSAIQMEERRRTATHILAEMTARQDSNGQEARDNSHPGRDVMAAHQQFKWRPGGAQRLTYWKGCTSAFRMEAVGTWQLTFWKGRHGRISAIQMEVVHCSSHSGRDVMAAHQQFTMEARSRTATHILEGTSWLHVSDSNGGSGRTATHNLEGTSWLHVSDSNGSSGRTATHMLEGMSWPHISDSNGGQEAHGSSHSGRDVMAARQRLKWRSGGAQRLTV